MTCHDPHSGEPPHLRAGSSAGTCFACHGDKQGMLGGGHAAIDEAGSPCTPCHPAHGRPPQGGGPDPAAKRCLACHGEDHRSLPAHTARGAPAWKRMTVALPLFDSEGKRNEFGFMSCPTCHDVHAAPERRAMRLEDRDPPDLCTGCHGEKTALLGSPHDPRQGGSGAACTVCHPVHSKGDEPPLWQLREAAAGTWNDRKCSPCHGPPDDAPLLHAGPNSHPVNRLLPDGRNSGGLPLYDPLGGRAGRLVTCSTCHDLHGTARGAGGANEKYLRLGVREGELCAVCHSAETAISGTPHDTRNDPEGGASPCAPCHRVHRASTKRFLWNLAPAEGDYFRNTLCRSCHRVDGPAPSDSVLMQHHMKDAEELLTPRGTIYLQRPMLLLDEWAVKTGDPPVIPLFGKDGVAGPSGNLQCVSCHDPHVWSPMGAFIKPDFGALGPNVATQYLRLKDPKLAQRSVCAGCHPQDAEKRYRMYHYVWEDLGGALQ